MDGWIQSILTILTGLLEAWDSKWEEKHEMAWTWATRRVETSWTEIELPKNNNRNHEASGTVWVRELKTQSRRCWASSRKCVTATSQGEKSDLERWSPNQVKLHAVNFPRVSSYIPWETNLTKWLFLGTNEGNRFQRNTRDVNWFYTIYSLKNESDKILTF